MKKDICVQTYPQKRPVSLLLEKQSLGRVMF